MVKRIFHFFTEFLGEILSGHVDLATENDLFSLDSLFSGWIFDLRNTKPLPLKQR